MWVYPHVVTFQAPTFTQLPSGQPVPEWDDVAGLTELPARFIPVVGMEEEQAERMVVDADRFTIVVQGDRAVEREMRAVTDYLGMELGVVKVQRPVLYRSARTYATIVTAERVTAEAGS